MQSKAHIVSIEFRMTLNVEHVTGASSLKIVLFLLIINTHFAKGPPLPITLFWSSKKLAGFVQARTSGYSHRNSNLAHAQTECPSAVLLQSPEYNVANVISIKLGSSSQCALTYCERVTWSELK